MTRPRTYAEDRAATVVRLPVSLHRRLQRAAVEGDVSANLLVARAVVERLEPAETAGTAGTAFESGETAPSPNSVEAEA